MNLSYITTGSTRTIKIGDRKISFRHASPKNFAAKGRVIPLLIQGIKEIGEESMSGVEYEAIRRFIDKQQDPYLKEDLPLAPAWIQRIIKKARGRHCRSEVPIKKESLGSNWRLVPKLAV